MRIHVFSSGPELPSARIRWYQLAPFLERHGIETVLRLYPRQDIERERLRDELVEGEPVILHRHLLRPDEVAFWRALPSPLIFDFDDAVMLRKERKLGSHFSWKRRRRFRQTLRACDAAIAGNEFLATFAADLPVGTLVSASPVSADVPSALDRAPNTPARVGWVGVGWNLRYLREIEAPLADLAREREFELAVLCDEDFHSRHVPVRNLRWSLEDQDRELASFDIGVMPLWENSAWSKGKCAYKVLQYMAAGSALVASPVGMNTQVIQHGRNGLLAATRREWLDHLRELLDAPERRAEMGRQARADVARYYAYPVVAERVAEFLNSL